MIIKFHLLLILFFLIFNKFYLILCECGCGSRCSVYSLPKHCVRCCTSFVKREILFQNKSKNRFNYKKNRKINLRKNMNYENINWNNSKINKSKYYSIFDGNIETVQSQSISSSEDLLLSIISEVADKINRKKKFF
uniref:Uncharacterized protein n=1 Tax=Strongyloides stercoralis TaxID=6248 RepID=A0A0K0DZ24_STRER